MRPAQRRSSWRACSISISASFVPIRSEQFGYDGTLTLFDSNALHRIETIDPFDRNKDDGPLLRALRADACTCATAETDRLTGIARAPEGARAARLDRQRQPTTTACSFIRARSAASCSVSAARRTRGRGLAFRIA